MQKISTTLNLAAKSKLTFWWYHFQKLFFVLMKPLENLVGHIFLKTVYEKKKYSQGLICEDVKNSFQFFSLLFNKNLKKQSSQKLK